MKNYIKISVYISKVVKEERSAVFIYWLDFGVAWCRSLPFLHLKIQSEIIDSIIEIVKTSTIITTSLFTLISPILELN